MKITMLLLVVLILGAQLPAQNAAKKVPVSIGYFGNLGFQPGLKVGTQMELKTWKNGTNTKSFYLSPQIGFYVYPNVNTTYLANVDIGYKKAKDLHHRYSAFSIGLGFLNQAQIIERRISLNDGSKEKIVENWGWFLSTLNYEFGKPFNENIGWYGKLSTGVKLSPKRESAMVLLTELGLRFDLFSK